MERSTQRILALILAVSSPLSASADLAFRSVERPAATSRAEEQEYPASRFGFEPARVETGLRDSYTARIVREEDEEQRMHPVSASRAPAGLHFKGEGAERQASSERERPAVAPIPADAASEPEAAPPIPSTIATQMAMRTKGVQEVAIIANDLGFFPKTFFVSRDVPVRLYVTGASKNTLCIMMDTFQVRKQVRANRIEEITFTPGMAGKYRFYCPVNGMEGNMVVRELASSAQE